MHRNIITPYFLELAQRIEALGGIFNAHLHLDRAGTFHATEQMLMRKGVQDGASFSLAGKHALIPMVHASELYHPEVLEERVASYLERMASVGTTRADTLVDVTPDAVGTSALEIFLKLRKRFAGRLEFNAGAYSPLGFRDDEPHRWELLVEGARHANFIGLLPERDDKATYPDHIGFKESCKRAIALAHQMGKKIHIHTDQANHRYENGSETVVEVVRELGTVANGEEPFIWLVHVISPSTYEEARFNTLVENLAQLNIGVITCPSAAISMRQYRKFNSPTFNSIARVLELLAGGVQVRLGSDNICDITSPMGTTDVMDELFVLGNAIRYYDLDIMAKLGAGVRLDSGDREKIRVHLEEDARLADAVVNLHQGQS
jgi:cytosine/creatinine deaminase